MSAKEQFQMAQDAAQSVESGTRFLSWALDQMAIQVMDGKPVPAQVLADASDIASLLADRTDYLRDRITEGELASQPVTRKAAA